MHSHAGLCSCMLTLKWCNFMFRHFTKQICAESWTECLMKDWWHADTLCFEIHRTLFNNSQSHRLFYSSFHSDNCISIIRHLQPALHKVLILCSKDLIRVHLSAYGSTGVTFLFLKSKTILILSNSSDNGFYQVWYLCQFMDLSMNHCIQMRSTLGEKQNVKLCCMLVDKIWRPAEFMVVCNSVKISATLDDEQTGNFQPLFNRSSNVTSG